MFDLETAIRQWKKALAVNPGLEDGQRAELETCLRDEVADLVRRGQSPEEAFRQVSTEMGKADDIGYEFFKVYAKRRFGPPSWKRAGFSPALLWNYLVVALRKIKRQKGYAIINVAGLAIGIGVSLFIFLWIWDESSFDRFHSGFNDICRVTQDQKYSDGTVFPVAVTPELLGPGLKQDFPEVLEFTRFRRVGRNLLSFGEKQFYESGIAFADPSFLKVFTFPLVKGNPETALGSPDSLVITETAARKYFGSEDPLGRTLRLANTFDFKVTGVARDIPSNSHLQFDFLGNFTVLIKNLGYGPGWWNNDFYTYLRLAPQADFDKLAAAVEGYLTKVAPTKTRIRLQHLQDVHLRSSYAIDIDGPSRDRSQVVAVFAGVAFLVLLIACINYMNLATARSGLRSKEVGLRKVVGAGRADIMRQFFGESLLFAAISSCAAAGLASLLLPLFNSLTGKTISPADLAGPPVIMFLAGVALVAGVLSGIYPALFLSAFRPASIFRGESLSGARSALFRKSLVVLQFGLSIVFIAGTLVIAAQIRHMQTRDLGYDKDSLVYFPLRGELRKNYQAFRSELLRSAGILGVTSSSGVPTYTVQSTSAFDWEGRSPGESILVHHYSVGYDYFETLGMEMVKGRSFSREFPSDKDAYIVNETAARLMGYNEPLGKTVSLLSRLEGPIIGVVKDFNFKSLHVNVEPLVLRIEPARDNYVFVKTGLQNIAPSLETIRRLHGKHNPGYPLEYEFLDEALGELYRSDRQFGAVIRVFTGLAIFISCLGLLGLASFLAEKRTKEIGIRKVLGARVAGLVLLQTGEFSKWILVAGLISAPAAYYAAGRWLRGFAYHITPSAGIFLAAILATWLVALLAVGFQSVRAARANPVESLRHE